MIDKKIGIIVAVAVILAVIASGCLFAGKTTQGATTPTASPTQTPTVAPTDIAPVVVATEGAGMETPDIQVGAPNENLDLGSLV